MLVGDVESPNGRVRVADTAGAVSGFARHIKNKNRPLRGHWQKDEYAESNLISAVRPDWTADGRDVPARFNLDLAPPTKTNRRVADGPPGP